jgi:hypothetical protein
MTQDLAISAALAQLSQNLGGPSAGFSSFLEPVHSLVGPCYFAVSLLGPQTELRRIYSSEAGVYPVGNVKSMVGTGWETALVLEGRHLFSPDVAGLRFAFQDADAIVDLGFGCAINLRLAWNGQLLGSANLLAGPNAFDAETFHRAKALVAPLSLMTAWYIDHHKKDL